MEITLGEKLGRWTVLSYGYKRGPHHYWLVQCECGTEAIVQGGSLKTGRSFSCGCYRKEAVRKAQTTHGQTNTLIYDVWTRMKQRCENPKATNYKYYGGRGIKVCKRWQLFEQFFEDMGSGWKKGLTIERINGDGDYKPSNCRWATKQEQAINRSSTVMLYTKWGLISVSELARRTGINRRTLAYRISKYKEN